MRSIVQVYPGPPENQSLVASRSSLAFRSRPLFAHDQRPKTDDGVGAVAQLGERLVCNQEATGSIPVSSTRNRSLAGKRVCFWQGGFVSGHGLSRAALRRRRLRLVDSILGLGGLLVPIVAILVGGAIAITGMIHRHAERIAKIERGMDPDAGPPRT